MWGVGSLRGCGALFCSGGCFLGLLLGVVADRVVVSYSPLRVVSGLIVYGGRVVYCGDAGFVEDFIRRFGGELVDYGGYTVLPGFHDPHLHLGSLAAWDKVIDLGSASSIDELLGIVRDVLGRGGSGWIVGRGWDHMRFRERRLPTLRDLERLGTDRPVLLVRVCGHVAVANRAALEKLGACGSGDVDWDNGLLYEGCVETMWRKALEEIGLEPGGYAAVLERLYRHGIVGIGWMSASLGELVAYHGLETVKPYTRVYLEPSSFMEWIGYGLPVGTLDVYGVKIVFDGSLGAHTAYLSKPYSDKPCSNGRLNIGVGELEKYMLMAREKGYHVAVHAIGDKALDIVLELYSRHGLVGERIEHASLVRNNQIGLIAGLRPRIALQPGFILSDTWLVDRMGWDRLSWAYRVATLSRVAEVGFSSDAPVEPLDPWRNIYAAVTRGEYEGLDIAVTVEEKIDIPTALHLHTRGSAETLYYSDKGRLEQGYTADYIVVDRNPLEISDPRELLKISIVETRVAGEKVYPR